MKSWRKTYIYNITFSSNHNLKGKKKQVKLILIIYFVNLIYLKCYFNV